MVAAALFLRALQISSDDVHNIARITALLQIVSLPTRNLTTLLISNHFSKNLSLLDNNFASSKSANDGLSICGLT